MNDKAAPCTAQWIEHFPALKLLDDATLAKLDEAANLVNLPAGARAFESGGQCEHYLLVTKGVVRVQQVSESGGEIVLYRVGSGETCFLTTASLLAHQVNAAEGVAETMVEAVVLPSTTFDQLIELSPGFRNFVFSGFANRLTDLMVLVDELAFRRIDARLVECLLDRCDAEGFVTMTHKELAAELGSAREVVSRQLKDFERHGWVKLERCRVQVVDPDGFQQVLNKH